MHFSWNICPFACQLAVIELFTWCQRTVDKRFHSVWLADGRTRPDSAVHSSFDILLHFPHRVLVRTRYTPCSLSVLPVSTRRNSMARVIHWYANSKLGPILTECAFEITTTIPSTFHCRRARTFSCSADLLAALSRAYNRTSTWAGPRALLTTECVAPLIISPSRTIFSPSGRTRSVRRGASLSSWPPTQPPATSSLATCFQED